MEKTIIKFLQKDGAQKSIYPMEPTLGSAPDVADTGG